MFFKDFFPSALSTFHFFQNLNHNENKAKVKETVVELQEKTTMLKVTSVIQDTESFKSLIWVESKPQFPTHSLKELRSTKYN